MNTVVDYGYAAIDILNMIADSAWNFGQSLIQISWFMVSGDLGGKFHG